MLSGNRNFEARIHASIKANFLASPPLVVAYAIAGRVNINLDTEPLGIRHGRPAGIPERHLAEQLRSAGDDEVRHRPRDVPQAVQRPDPGLPLWNEIPAPPGNLYQWDESTYIARPPFFEDFSMAGRQHLRRHFAMPERWRYSAIRSPPTISARRAASRRHPPQANTWKEGSAAKDFNSYGARRGNHEVMMRGTFANVRIKNLMLPAKDDGSRVEGGYTLYKGEQMAIYDAAMKYIADGTPTVIFAGEEYGTGSSRDWAAKGTQLLGVKAVIAKSYERIHRSNLVGMGVLPLQFKGDANVAALHLTGDETFDIGGIDENLKPQQDVTLTIRRKDGSTQQVPLLLRIDTPIEVDYYRHGGILPYVLRELVSK